MHYINDWITYSTHPVLYDKHYKGLAFISFRNKDQYDLTNNYFKPIFDAYSNCILTDSEFPFKLKLAPYYYFDNILCYLLPIVDRGICIDMCSHCIHRLYAISGGISDCSNKHRIPYPIIKPISDVMNRNRWVGVLLSESPDINFKLTKSNDRKLTVSYSNKYSNISEIFCRMLKKLLEYSVVYEV